MYGKLRKELYKQAGLFWSGGMLLAGAPQYTMDQAMETDISKVFKNKQLFLSHKFLILKCSFLLQMEQNYQKIPNINLANILSNFSVILG